MTNQVIVQKITKPNLCNLHSTQTTKNSRSEAWSSKLMIFIFLRSSYYLISCIPIDGIFIFCCKNLN